MYSMGFSNVWLAQGVGDAKVFLLIVKQRINDNFTQNWESRLDDSSRALFYNSIRSFDFQPYLAVCNINKYRSALCKFRMSAHRLEIETGRWHKPSATPRNERKCKMCNVLEDEYHFVCECVLYTDIRRKYIKKYFWNRPSMQKLISLFNSGMSKEIRNLAIFIEKAFLLRNEYIYAVSAT